MNIEIATLIVLYPSEMKPTVGSEVLQITVINSQQTVLVPQQTTINQKIHMNG